MKKRFLLSVFISFGILSAQDNTVMKSLKLAPSAISSGRADNGVANPVNVAMAMHFNPAGLLYNPDMKGFNFAFTLANHNSGLPDPDGGYAFLAGGYKVPSLGAFGVSIRYLGLGSQDEIPDGERFSVGAFESYEFEMSFAYARMLSKKLSIGFKTSYLKSKLFGEGVIYTDATGSYEALSPSTVAMDLGFLYKMGGYNDIVIGASLSNLGGKMQFLKRPDGRNRFDIPTIFRLGVKANLYEFDSHYGRITGETEVRFLSAVGSSTGLNVNYEYEELFEVRMGYVFDNDVFKGSDYFSFGLGVKFDVHTIDFSSQVLGDELGQVNPSSGTPNYSYVLNMEEPSFNDDQEVQIDGYDDFEGDEENLDYDDANRVDDAVENFKDKENNLYNKLEKEAGYSVVNSSGNKDMELESEVYDEGFMERIVRSESVKDLDYIVSNNIIMIVVADETKKDNLRFHISHLKYHMTDTYTGESRKFTYVKGGKGKSIILFNKIQGSVERCYTESSERNIFFVIDNIKYKYDRELKTTSTIEFLE